MSDTVLKAQQPRYDLLDGLRGVAAFLVILYHFGEGFATSPVDQMMNHGYLAVDFFFVLSGFVLGYAYDARMASGKISSASFMLRRVIRLHPMVILSMILGAVAFLIQGSVKWDGSPVSLSLVALSLLLGLFLIPMHPSFPMEVRGNGEMFPLVGPAWSLFFEYIGSIIYAFALWRMNVKQLRAVVVVSGLLLAACVLGNISGAYHQGVGWTMAGLGFAGGFLRMMFSFSVGVLMVRTIRHRRIRGAFWICSALIAATLSCPYVGSTTEPSILNGFYDLACTFIVFPAVVWIGACGAADDAVAARSCEFLGRLSYPVYIIHYPLMYLFYAWVWNNGITPDRAWPVCAGIFVAIVALAWLAMKYYDEPVRSWLTAKLISKSRRTDGAARAV